MTTAESEALRFGTLFHHALEAWWLNFDQMDDLAFAKAIEAIREHAGDTDPYEVIKAEELIFGYHVRWHNSSFIVIAVEAEFRTALINPETNAPSKSWQLGGKIDVIVRDCNGRVLIIEHKTSGEDISPGSSYWGRLRLDGQISGYFKGAESLGYKPEACIYDVIGKPKLRPLKATPEESRKYTTNGRLYANQRLVDETPEEYRLRLREDIGQDINKYFQRAEIVRLQEEMHEHDLDTWQQAQSMRDAKRLGIAPKNPEACSRFGALCGYYGVCTGEKEIEDTTLFKKLDWPHPELTNTENDNG